MGSACHRTLTKVCKMSPLLLLFLCVTLCCGHNDNEDWMDPTDMFNYDGATGKMIKQEHNIEENGEAVYDKNGEATCSDNNKALVLAIKTPMQTIEELKREEDVKIPKGNSNPIFRRYLRKMLSEAERFGLPEDSNTEVYYNAEMVLSKQMIVEIQKFIDDNDWNLGALEDALIRSLVHFRYHNVKEWWSGVFEDYLGIDLSTMCKILVGFTCIVSIIATEIWSRIGWFTQIRRIFLISFIVSLFWNWVYLYKVAFAERQAELAKLQNFGSCGEKMSWSESLFEWWRGAGTFQNDPCEEYFKALMISPALMVPPTKALILTFTDFVTEPLKHLGKGLGEFLNGLLAEIPVFYQLLVLILIAVIFMISCYGAATTFVQVVAHRHNRAAPQERLPSAAPQEPHYGNAIEGYPQQPVYLEEPVHRYPRNRRPENLQALDTSDGKQNKHLPGFTDVDSSLKDKYGEQELRENELPEQSRGITEEQMEASAFRNHQKKPQKEKSVGEQQREEDPTKQKFTNYQRDQDSRKEMTNKTQQSKKESPHKRLHPQQIEVEPVDQGGDHPSIEKALQEGSGQKQSGEISVEEISHTERSWMAGHLDNKALELKGVLKEDPVEQKIDGEESSPHCQTIRPES